MPHSRLTFHDVAREKVLRGATTLTDALRVTLGPKSKSVLIGRKWGTPTVCNDGATIAKEVTLRDAEENLGVQLLRQAAEQTAEAVGDGTTTATVLAHAIFAEGFRNLAAGASGVDLRRGLERGLHVAVAAIRALSRPIESHAQRVQIATISAHNDAAMGELVAQALETVGPDGVVSVEEARGTETRLDAAQGLRFDRGFLSPYFITDPEKRAAILEDPYVLLHDRRIASAHDLLPLLELVVRQGGSLLVVAEDVDAEALATLALNRIRGTLPCVAVRSPGYGERRRDVLGDLAVLTGGQVVAEELGLRLENVRLEHLGRAHRVVVDKDTTTLIGGAGAKEAVEARCREIRHQIDEAKSEYDSKQVAERLARLTGGVAVLRVGAMSEAELKVKKETFDDAIAATRAAMREGVVPGCGLALLRAIEAVEAEAAGVEGDVRTGLLALRHALEAPTRQIAANSSADGGVVVERMRNGQGAYGYDAARGQYVDLVEAGIIDPTQVVRTALENAVSVAGMLLMTEATLTEVEDEDEDEAKPIAGEGAEVP